MRLYLDASAIIYGVEGNAERRANVERLVTEAKQTSGGELLTSELSWMECRVKPLRQRDARLLDAYALMLHPAYCCNYPVTRTIIDRATQLRADHGFKTPDAIHLATALTHHADTFLTGDRALSRCEGLRVEVVT